MINHCLARSEWRSVEADGTGAHINNIGQARCIGIPNGVPLAVIAEEFGAVAQG